VKTQTSLPLQTKAVEPELAAERFLFSRSVARSLRRAPLVMFAIGILLFMFIVAGVAPLIAPHDPAEVRLLDRLKPPGYVDKDGGVHFLGTDNLGQDLLSRLIYGARVSLLVGITTVMIGGTLGMVLGIVSGYYGKLLDDIIMRVADIQLAFPSILLYIAVLVVLGPGLEKVIGILGITSWVTYGRVTRGEVLSIRDREYVEAARAIGATDWRIMTRHILPNTMAPFIVVASFAMASAIIAESSLSFLGLGVPPSIPTWGAMLAQSRDYLRDAWWPVTFPGVAIMLTVLSVNIVGDWLRDFLDPRLRGR
jgi:peptide/nickel transport system permease protein